MRASFLVKLIDQFTGRLDQVISVRLPYCPNCQSKELEIKETHWDEYQVEVYCHPGFRQAVGKIET